MRHLQRGRPGARAVPQADEPPRPHRVPPRRPHQPRPARGPARHDVRRHGHRLAGRERLPADQGVRAGGPRLLRRRAGDPRPGRRRGTGRRQPDRDPHRRRRPRRPTSTVTAGATLVRDSDAAYEVAETHAKAGGILSAFGLVPAAPTPSTNVAELVIDEDVLLALNARNRRLSRFWLTDQGGSPPDPRLHGQERGDPRRRGRLREHAAPRPRRARHDQRGRPARGVRARACSTASTW